MTSLEIRDAVPSDVPRIESVFVAARATAMPWLPVLHTREQNLGFFGRVVATQQAYVAVLDGSVVGFAVVDDDEAMLEHLYLDPAAHRRGIGRSLLEHARAAHDGPLELWCFADNRSARAFYASCGARDLYGTDGSANEERTPDVRLELPAWER